MIKEKKIGNKRTGMTKGGDGGEGDVEEFPWTEGVECFLFDILEKFPPFGMHRVGFFFLFVVVVVLLIIVLVVVVVFFFFFFFFFFFCFLFNFRMWVIVVFCILYSFSLPLLFIPSFFFLFLLCSLVTFSRVDSRFDFFFFFFLFLFLSLSFISELTCHCAFPSPSSLRSFTWIIHCRCNSLIFCAHPFIFPLPSPPFPSFPFPFPLLPLLFSSFNRVIIY